MKFKAGRGYGQRLLPRPTDAPLTPASFCTPPVTGISLPYKATIPIFVDQLCLATQVWCSESKHLLLKWSKQHELEQQAPPLL